MRLAAVVVIAALAHPALGWSSISQTNYGAQVDNILEQQRTASGNGVNYQQLLGYLWTLPADVGDKSGLGGGIAWAWDPEACDQLLTLFREDLFFVELVDCGKLKAAMHRAFATWSANHEYINFIDVTSECEALHGAVHRNCSLVELWVTSRDDASASVGGYALEAASATSIPRLAGYDGIPSFRYTNGVTTNAIVVETYEAVIAFGTGNCWYLDSTFCSYFHSLKKVTDTDTVMLAGQLACFVLTSFSGLFLLLQILWVFRVSTGKTCKKRWSAAAQAMAKWSVCLTAIKLVLFVTPLLFYFFIFLPCWDCYDFEAAATHEVGHVLGLGHPDLASVELSSSACNPSCGGGPACTCGPAGENVYNADLYAGKRMGLNPEDLGVSATEDYTYDASATFEGGAGTSCITTFDSVTPGIPDSYDPGLIVSGVRESIMISFTQHNPGVCLTEDDLEGLLTLYPDCTHAVSTPVCYKIEHYIGWLRLGVFILLPVLLSLLITILLSTVTQEHQVKRLASARNLLRVKSQYLSHANARADHNLAQARNMQSELELQKATEASRIEEEARRLSSVYIQSAGAFASTGSGAGRSVPKLNTSAARSSADDGGFRWLNALKGVMTPRSSRASSGPSAAASPVTPSAASSAEATVDCGGGAGLFSNISRDAADVNISSYPARPPASPNRTSECSCTSTTI